MQSDSATNIKNKFSAYLDRVKRGEVILILEYGRPVAQLCKPDLCMRPELALLNLERDGLVAPPSRSDLDAEQFLSARVKPKKKPSLVSALLNEREGGY